MTLGLDLGKSWVHMLGLEESTRIVLRHHVKRVRLAEGFSHFVISMTSSVASGCSDRQVGLAPIGKRRLTTSHTQLRH